MKTTVIAATIALGLMAGTALADQPMVLTNAQLDRVTGGATMVEYGLLLVFVATDKEVSGNFTAAERAGKNDRFLGGFEPDAGIYVKTVPKGFGFIQPDDGK